MSKPCILGIFSPEGFKKSSDSVNVGEILNSDNTFLFFYLGETKVHYKIEQTEKFLVYSKEHENKSISFIQEGADKIWISMVQNA